MLALISEKASGRTKERLLEMWRNDTKQQETISIRRWDNKNKVWLEKNASEFTTKHADKNPFIRQDTRNPASYEPTRGQNRPTTSNNRGWNSNTRQYRSTDAQQQSYANAVQQNIRQFSRNQDGNEPRTDTNVTYIGQRFNNQRRDEQPISFNTARQRTNDTRGRTYGQNRPTPSQRQYTPYADNGNTSRQRPYQRNINQNYFRQGGGINDRNVTYNTHSLNDIQDASIKVINLSNRALTETEQSILGKGLKFTPTPQKPNSQELKEDLAAFT